MMNADRDFLIRPNNSEKFRAVDASAIIASVQQEELQTEIYDAGTADSLAEKIAEQIRSRIKGLNLPHYKYIVQVHISEQRGQGVNITSQCVWDTDCDAVAHKFYNNNSLWCQASVYAIFNY